MSYAHKLATYSDDAHNPVVYCSVCGHETNLSAPCPGEYVLSEKEQKHIDDCFTADMLKIFGDVKGNSILKRKHA